MPDVTKKLSDRKAPLVLIALTLLVLSVFVVAHDGDHWLEADDSLNPDADFVNTTPEESEAVVAEYPHWSDFGQTVPIAFRGEDIYVNISFLEDDDENDQAPFNITNISGGLVDSGVGNQADGVFGLSTDSSNASEDGRYVYWGDWNDPDDHRHIDLVSSEYNVTGRIAPTSGGSLTNVKIELRYWENLSLIDHETRDDINLTVDDWPEEGGEERIYRINTSTLEKFWIGVTADGYGWNYNPSRSVGADDGNWEVPSVELPHINDIGALHVGNGPTEATVVGELVYEDGTPAEGVEVRLTGMCEESLRCFSRMPYMERPPVMTNMTNSSGYATFNGVYPGAFIEEGEDIIWEDMAAYSVSVTNDSVARVSGDVFMPDFFLEGEGFFEEEVEVTDTVGHINGTIEGDDEATYVIGAMNTETGEALRLAPQENISNISVRALPNGTYSVIAAEVEGGNPVAMTSETVEIETDTTTTLHFEFPETVTLTGNVTDEADNPVENVRVEAENQTDFQFYSTRTEADGSYTLQVVNDTSYDVRLFPPHDSEFSETTENVAINKSETVKNFTLSTGEWLAGYVETSGGEPVDAHVYIWGDSTFQDAATDEDGFYNITGLEAGEQYSFNVYPFEPGVERNRSTFTLVQGQDWRNVTLEADTRDISGFVTDEADNALNATVRLVNHDQRQRQEVETNSSGGYNFTDQPRHSYYTIRVRPDNASFGPDDQSFGLSDDRIVDFTLETTTSVSGYVLDESDTGVENAEVFAFNWTTDTYGWTRTDADGSYQIELREGGYNIEAWKEGFAPNLSTVVEVSEESTQNLTLSQGVSLSGQITENQQPTPYSGEIAVWNREHEAFGHSEIVNGEYNITGLQDNIAYNVWFRVDTDEFTPDRESVDLSELSEPYEKNFSVAGNKGQKLNVTVTSSGAPLANATVRTPLRERTTNDAGFVTFPNQSIGGLTISINKDGYRGVLRTENIDRPGQLGVEEYKSLSVSLDQVVETEVDVNVTRDGEAVSSVSTVFVSNETGISQHSSAVTGGDGETTVEGLVDGDYLLTLGISEDEVHRDSVTVDSDAGAQTSEGFDGSEYDVWFNAE